MPEAAIAIVCPDCETRREVAVDNLAAAIVEHNNLHHSGDEVAEIAGGGVDWGSGDRR